MNSTIRQRLDSLVERYNIPSFADSDPVRFPRQFSDVRDIEISALLTSIISWGRRAMILNNAAKLHGILQNEPYRFVTEGDIDAISDDNIHRTFFGRHLRYALRGLRETYRRHGSLEALAALHVDDAAPAWAIARHINAISAEANADHPLCGSTRCLPDNVDKSALKRLNMALRWLVRNDGIVDMGVWTALTPAQLYIPLDVHSAATARTLGLLTRKANDRTAVNELTDALRTLRPTDPTIYDYALFGAGEEGVI